MSVLIATQLKIDTSTASRRVSGTFSMHGRIWTNICVYGWASCSWHKRLQAVFWWQQDMREGSRQGPNFPLWGSDGHERFHFYFQARLLMNGWSHMLWRMLTASFLFFVMRCQLMTSEGTGQRGGRSWTEMCLYCCVRYLILSNCMPCRCAKKLNNLLSFCLCKNHLEMF